MGITLIISCVRCGGLFLIANGQRTRTCPFCGTRNKLDKAKKIASAEDAFTASEILRDLKNRRR